jgi:hypothetical protein
MGLILAACSAGEAPGGAAAGSAEAGSGPDGGTEAGDADVDVGVTRTSFSLTSPASGKFPFTLGQGFRQGDVPNGRFIAASIPHAQMTVKNRWPDGSIKFAIVAGQAELSANQPLQVTLATSASAPVGAPLSTADLAAAGVKATVGAGAFGSVSWSGADWEQPFAPWISGAEMSSWIYRKPVGTDPHLVAWLEVRLYAGGAVDVLPWVENGYLMVAGPTNKSATYTFSLGGTERFSGPIDLKHHTRTPLISGAILSHRLGSGPELTIRHDVDYLMATELVPTYQAVVAPDNSRVLAQPTSFTPLQQGSYFYSGDSMASAGYQEPIGLLPEHDVLYLTTTAPVAYASVIRNGFSAGRYALHYRDETTNRPIRFSSYPTLGLPDGSAFKDSGASGSQTPAPTGGGGPQWDCAHSPSVGYMAYLVAGRWYFMEEVQFAATANHIGKGSVPALRDGAKGLVKPEIGAWQTRSAAWQWRTLAQALSATPDDDTVLRGEFISSVQSNIDDMHGRYVAKPNNPFGWIKPGESYNGGLDLIAPWQQDFAAGAFGYSLALGLPIPPEYQTKLAAFFAWMSKGVITRLGPSSEWWYINGAPYTVKISPNANPNFDTGAGPWYATAAEMYAATYTPAPAWLGKTEGTLAGEIMPGANSMWGNLQPAISYAVRFGVPGAVEAYSRMTSASNWPEMTKSFNNPYPVWSVKPARGGKP